MKIKILIISLFLLQQLIGQNSAKESWSFGIGISNFTMNGDLKSKDSKFNLGGYIYTDKMLSPSIGFELKLSYTKISGAGKDNNFNIYNTSLDNLRFEGSTFEGETNVVYNISNLFNIHKTKKRKFGFTTLLGFGIHRYDTKLYEIDNNILIADFGNSPSKNGTTTSFYYTTAFNIQYKINKNLKLELRQNLNFNEDDHLDGVITKYSNLDIYFKTNIGIVYSFNDKLHKSFAWYDRSESGYFDIANDIDLTDSDNDNVIDYYDKDNSTPKGAIVYGDGTAIDSDNDGIIDFYDECPLEYAKTSTGCLKDIDSDKDGIIDSLDKCPNEFAKTSTGCIKDTDTDKDGILDVNDKCPNEYAKTPTGCKKDLDTDKDGIVDSKDKCPNEYAKSSTGCKKDIDTDGDGVVDINDECPRRYANTPSGCPKIIEETVTTKEAKVYSAIKPIKYNLENLTKEEKVKMEMIKEINKKNVSHGNFELDYSVNVNDVDTSPVYPDCIDKESKFDRTNCIISSISSFVNTNYNKTVANSINGKVRVLFIVKEDGSTKVIDVLGNYSIESKLELKRVIETLPAIQPGTLKGVPVPVKYSLLFLLK